MSLILAGTFAALFAITHGHTWEELEKSILSTMADVMQPVLILLLIGALIGIWILSGIVPSIIVWGLQIMSPSLFLFAASLISAIVSVATGSSWSTAGTIGVALIGIGQAMDVHLGMTAGAIISGAYFGDKLSPFSETTNLASSMAGTELFTHIRHMLYTTTPAMVISLGLYLLIGFTQDYSNFNPERIAVITNAINSTFDTSWYMLIPPAITITIMTRKYPAIPSILTGIFLGMLFAVLYQPDIIRGSCNDGGGNYFMAAVESGLQTAATGYSSNTGIKEVDALLSKGGMSGMLNTIWLILSAMFFTGVMDASGMLQRIAGAILQSVRGTGNLIAATLGTNILTNIVAAEQYLSIVITGRMYRDAYAAKGLHSKNLSRALEDAGTLTSPLVPWNTCGSFMASTLGVATFAYLPFAFLNLITPFISLIYGYTGYTIEYENDAPQEGE